jgi:sec-independent protein translocase protein TatC
MAEESESEPPSGPTDDEPPETASESDDRSSAAGDASDAAADDGETDTVDSSDDVPGGSIEDYLDDESIIETDERAPMGATGTPDPFDEDERRSVSDAVGAPVPDSELDDDPDLELDPTVAASDGTPDDDDAQDAAPGSDSAPRTGREMRGSTAPQHWQTDDTEGTGDDSAVETDADSVVETDADSAAGTGDDSVVQTTTDSAVETDGEPAESSAEPSVDAEFDAAEGTTDVLDDGLVGEGPASDEEMPLAAHIEEMVRRLAVVLVVGGVVGLAVFPVADQLINFLWNSHIPGAETITDRRPRLYGPLELVVTEIKVAALAGFVVGLPIAVYETYLFMRPGLFPRERRYYLAAVPTSLILALIGVAFAHFVVLPAIFAYFTAYTTGTAVVAFGLKETFSLILVLMGYMALVFQIPLFIMLAIMMNLTTRIWLEDRRLLFWGGFLGVAFLISPDPTGMAPIIVAATMITLFEGTLALLRWTGN